MNQNVLDFLVSFATEIGVKVTTAAISAAFQKVFGSRPDLEKRLAQPTSPADFENALAEATGVLEALAGSGSISIDGALISALRAARFDHQNGSIRIGNTTISAPLLHTGGIGKGQTVIEGNTELRSKGTGIKVGKGAGIIIKGNAGIKQT